MVAVALNDRVNDALLLRERELKFGNSEAEGEDPSATLSPTRVMINFELTVVTQQWSHDLPRRAGR